MVHIQLDRLKKSSKTFLLAFFADIVTLAVSIPFWTALISSFGSILFPVLEFLALASCLLIVVSKKKYRYRLPEGIRAQINQRDYAFSTVARIIALAILILVFTSLIFKIHRKIFAKNDFIIYVADFKGNGDDEFITNEIIRNIKNEIQFCPPSIETCKTIKVKPLNEYITEKSGGSDYAKEIGASVNASIVIWGGYNLEKGVYKATAKLDILPNIIKNLNPYNTESIDNQFTIKRSVSNGFLISNIEISEQISPPLSYISLIVLGLYQNNNHKEKRKELKLRGIDNSIAIFTKAINLANKSNVKNEIGYFLRGNHYLLKFHASSDKEYLKKSFNDFSSAIEQNKNYHAYNNIGYICLLQGDISCAKEMLNKSIEINDLRTMAHNNLVVTNLIYDRRKDLPSDDLERLYENSILELDKSISNKKIRLKNLGSKNFNLIFQSFLKLDYLILQNYLENQSYINDELSTLYSTRATVFLIKMLKYSDNVEKNGLMSDLELKFLNDINTSIRLNKRNFNSYSLRGGFFHNKFSNTRSKFDFNAAKESYLKAIKINPNFPDPFNNLGSLYYDFGNCNTLALRNRNVCEKAERHVFESLLLFPNNAASLLNLWIFQSDQGDVEKSLENLSKSLSLYPKHDEGRKFVFFYRSLVYKELGQLDKSNIDKIEYCKITSKIECESLKKLLEE